MRGSQYDAHHLNAFSIQCNVVCWQGFVAIHRYTISCVNNLRRRCMPDDQGHFHQMAVEYPISHVYNDDSQTAKE